jgi:hypothetical protein
MLAFVFANFVYGDNIRVVEGSGRVSFAEEARFRGDVEVVMGEQKLQCNDAMQARVVGAIDDAHSPGAERFVELEVGDGASGKTKGIRLAIARRQEGCIDRCELSSRASVGLEH